MLIHVLSVLPLDGNSASCQARRSYPPRFWITKGFTPGIPIQSHTSRRPPQSPERLPSSLLIENASVKQRQAISETSAKGGGGLVETCFSSLGWMVAFPGKRPWLGCWLQGLALIECNLKRDSTD